MARPAPSGPIQDSPSSKIRADRLPREMDAEAGIDEGPLPKIQRGGGGVAEIGGDHGAHRDAGHEGTAGKLRLLRGYLIGSGKFDRLIRDLRRQRQGWRLDPEHGRAEHDDIAAGAEPCRMPGSQGPAASGLVTTR